MSQNKEFHISGIQQVGIGNPNLKDTWEYYRKNFGFDTPVFEEEAEAELMLPYTGEKVQKRNAVLCLNMNGGGGLEIWQYTERKIIWAKEKIKPGDLGIHTLKIKCKDITEAFEICKTKGLKVISEIQKRIPNSPCFLVEDLHGNMLEIIQSENWFSNSNGPFGGVAGVAIGVSDIEKSLRFYGELLGFTKVLSDQKASFIDLDAWTGENQLYRRIVLERKIENKGPFSKLLGPMQLELIQNLTEKPNKIFKDRFWGDPGFIHLCFDVVGMDSLKEKCKISGFPFTVDSANSFDMGEAAGRFSYVEDPDSTLIEFVETHKVPILKKVGWYLNLQKRNPLKPLPNWMIKTMGWSRVKD